MSDAPADGYQPGGRAVEAALLRAWLGRPVLRDVPSAKFGATSILLLAALVSAIVTPLLRGHQHYQQSHKQQHS
jgi:hypothetical protein